MDKDDEYRPIIKYTIHENGEKLNSLLKWYEISADVPNSVNCLIRWLDPVWLKCHIHNYEILPEIELVRNITEYLHDSTMHENKETIIRCVCLEFLIHAGFGVDDTRDFDLDPVVQFAVNNSEIGGIIKNTLKYSTDGYIYGPTVYKKGYRDFLLSHDIMMKWTLFRSEKCN